MAVTIALANQKGGVGKTTTAVNLGACLNELGKRVLIVDTDAQGNATSGIGISKGDIQHDIYDVLVNGMGLEGVIMPTSRPHLDVVPATLQLSGAEIELASQIGREQRLADALEPVADRYDYVLVDYPPALGILTINAFTACDSILIPVQSEYYALEGLSQLMKTIQLVKKHYNADLHVEGVLLTMLDARTNLGNEVVTEVQKFFKDCVYTTIIPRNVRLSEAPSHGQAVIDYDRTSRGAVEYMALAKEVLAAHE